MSSRCRSKLIAALLVLLPVPGQAAAPLRICAEPDNLPMSQQATRSGFEIEVADLLAKEMGRTLKIVWVAQRDHSYYRQTLGKGTCDALMSVPAAIDRLTVTTPWYRSGFYFVARADAPLPHNFDEPAVKRMTIGVPATGLGDTPPAMALTHRALGQNLRAYSIYEPQKMVAAVAEKKIDLAILWGPFAGWFAGEAKPPLAIAPTPEKDGPLPLAFDMAIGVKKGNEALKGELEKALIEERPAIAAILKKWRVPVAES